jgi:hypothetical protein
MIVALYARVSTVKQAEKDLSIPDQLRQLREWCARQGHGVAVEYVESGASATDDRRPSSSGCWRRHADPPTPSRRFSSTPSLASSGTSTGSFTMSGNSRGPASSSSP